MSTSITALQARLKQQRRPQSSVILQRIHKLELAHSGPSLDADLLCAAAALDGGEV